jgi:DNA-binding MarR family transcriptional regulator
MKQQETVCYNIKSAWHAISRLYNEQASKHGSTASIGFILLNIDKQGGTPSTHIGPSLGLEPTSLSRILKSMEENGLIEKRPDENDKRISRIFLTDKGKILRKQAKEVVLEFNNAIRAQIPDSKLIQFFEVISEIKNILEQKNNSLTI